MTTTDPFTEAAMTHLAKVDHDESRDWFNGFLAAIAWARTRLAAQEPTDAEVGHAYAEWMNHSPIRDLDARRLNCTCGERGFTPYGYEHHRLHAALSAARAARRDEEKR